MFVHVMSDGHRWNQSTHCIQNLIESLCFPYFSSVIFFQKGKLKMSLQPVPGRGRYIRLAMHIECHCYYWDKSRLHCRLIGFVSVCPLRRRHTRGLNAWQALIHDGFTETFSPFLPVRLLCQFELIETFPPTSPLRFSSHHAANIQA